MDLRHQSRQRFINDVAFGSAGDAETLVLVCECGRAGCHDFVTVPRNRFVDLLPTRSPRVLAAGCARAADTDPASSRSPYVAE